MNRLAKTAIAVVAAALGGLTLISPTPAAAAGWDQADRNADGYYDIAGYDGAGDGAYEVVYIDTDFNGSWDVYNNTTGAWQQLYVFASRTTVWVYSDAGGNMAWVDADGNGLYERQTYDTGRDNVVDWHKIDTNGDGSFDSQWLQVTAPAAQSQTQNTALRLYLDQMMFDHNTRLVNIWL